MGNNATQAGYRGGSRDAPAGKGGSTATHAERAVTNLITRLRETAARLVPYSPQRLLLREAADAIERLDRALQDGPTPPAELPPA